MAVALDASTPAAVWADANATTSITTASFTPPSGSIVLAFVYSAGDGQTHGTPTGLTFSAGPVAVGTNTTRVSIFTATGGGSATTVTASFGGASEYRGLVVSVWTGAQLGGGTNTVVAGTGAASGSITTTGTNSVVAWACGDWNAIDGSGRVYRSSASDLAYHGSANITEYAAYQAAASAGAQTYGFTQPSDAGVKYNLAAIELQVASAASAPARRPQAITRVSGIRAATY